MIESKWSLDTILEKISLKICSRSEHKVAELKIAVDE